jgi:hypothetical protein
MAVLTKKGYEMLKQWLDKSPKCSVHLPRSLESGEPLYLAFYPLYTAEDCHDAGGIEKSEIFIIPIEVSE